VEAPPPTAVQRAQAEAASGNQRGNAAQRPAATAVLAVPLEDVERLTLAEKYGELTLALRHPDDTAVPDASLFAALPPALRPLAGRLPQGTPLQGADRAFAGLRFKDLATGSDAGTARRAPATGRSVPAPQPRTVELYQGSSVKRMTY
jgi:pilus assembly protein CpaB